VGERGPLHVRRAGPTRSLADILIATALEPVCAVCNARLDQPTTGPVCPLCWGSIRTLRGPLCVTCGDELPSWRHPNQKDPRCHRCRHVSSSLLSSRSAADYEGALRRIIHAFKYDGRRSLAAPLGALVKDAGAASLARAACVVPVPLHLLRRMRRGFNQASDLARTLGPPVVHALRRTRATPPQERLRAAARRRNVREAFAVARWISPATRSRAIEDQVVVLVDDVRTTGSTLDACAIALRRAGAREVHAVTVAIAKPHRKDSAA
jgi:ComF family protein